MIKIVQRNDVGTEAGLTYLNFGVCEDDFQRVCVGVVTAKQAEGYCKSTRFVATDEPQSFMAGLKLPEVVLNMLTKGFPLIYVTGRVFVPGYDDVKSRYETVTKVIVDRRDDPLEDFDPIARVFGDLDNDEGVYDEKSIRTFTGKVLIMSSSLEVAVESK